MRLTDEPHEDKQGAMTHGYNKTIPEQYAQLVEYSIRTGKEVNLSIPRSLQMGVEITINNNNGTVVTDIKHDSTGDFGDDSLIPPED